MINIGYIFKEKWIVSSMGAFGSSCAASKYIQCIEETDFRFLLEAKRCNMEKIGVSFHVVNVLYPVSVGFFVKGPFTTRRRQKVADFFWIKWSRDGAGVVLASLVSHVLKEGCFVWIWLLSLMVKIWNDWTKSTNFWRYCAKNNLTLDHCADRRCLTSFRFWFPVVKPTDKP